MKKLLILALCFLLNYANGQDKMTADDLGIITLNEDGIYQIEKIISADGMNPDEIYSKVRLWFGETFKDSRAVLEIDDPVSGTLMGRVWTLYSEPGLTPIQMQLWHNIKVFIKDGRYKLVLDNFDRKFADNIQKIYYSEAEHAFTNRVYKKNGEMRATPKAMKDAIINVSDQYIFSLEKKVEKSSIDGGDDW